MKLKLLIIPALFLQLVAFGQAPQAFNYQAAVYDASNNPISNQLVSLRISILDGSAVGPVLYSESFSTTTDNSGLFSISVGNGTVLSGTFSTINWANGSKWQKTEIDTSGGSTFILMGSSQYMSVPYALYAQQSNASSFDYPDGMDNISPINIAPNTSYTVPLNKNLYIENYGDYNGYTINGDTVRFGSFLLGYKRNVLAASENSIVLSSSAINGFLVNKKVTWIIHNFLASGAYTVPAGKLLVLLDFGNNLGQYTINGNSCGALRGNFLILDQNDVLSFSSFGSGFAPICIGYLRDK